MQSREQKKRAGSIDFAFPCWPASRSLSLDHTAAGARSVVTSLERGMSVGIGALGALFVLSDQMTVGALVAFTCWGCGWCNR